MDQKTNRLISSYIAIQMERGMNTDCIISDFRQCGISRQDLADCGLLVGGNVSPSGVTSISLSQDAIRLLAAMYKRACEKAEDTAEDIADSFARMGFTHKDLKAFELEDLAEDMYGTDEYFNEDDEQPGPICPVDIINMKGMPRAFRIEDYTLEECPHCETEVVIRSRGVSICPKCKRVILPCTKCDSCTTPCPYGYTGRYGERLRPTCPPVSKEEAQFYLDELKRRKRNG